MNKYFNIFKEIQGWSKELSGWERLALLHLVQKGKLTEDDIKEIYEELKIDLGLTQAPDPRNDYDLGTSFIPQESKAVKPLILSKIEKIKGINAIPDGQSISCGPSLTVIYGANGSGKSGYARILKAASFTRSPDISIYGNVKIPVEKRPAPEATFVFEDGTSVPFTPKVPCPQLRDNFAVFDNSCVRVFVNEKKDFNILPYGFDVFPGLAAILGRLKQLLEAEVLQRTPTVQDFHIDKSDSEVARLLNNLSASTDLDTIKRLAVFGIDEEIELHDTDKSLQELIKNDPDELIADKRAKGKQIKVLITNLKRVSAIKNSNTHTVIRTAIESVVKLKELASAASVAQFGKEPIQPIGTDTWRTLIETAIKYNSEVNPNKTFPVDEAVSLCVLCQQPLTPDAKDRLTRFYTFVRSVAEQDLRNGLKKLADIRARVEVIDLRIYQADAVVRQTIQGLDKSISEQIEQYVNSIGVVKAALLKNIQEQVWTDVSLLSSNPISLCVGLRIKLAKEIRTLRKQVVSKERERLERELQTLRDRKFLNGKLKNVEEAVNNLRWIAKAVTGKKVFNPKHITDKQKALTTELIGKGFIEQFEKECGALGLNHLLKVNITGSEAVTSRRFGIGVPGTMTETSQILSEGEQTAVALADFLTEISLNERRIGIVFDDPVSSMDHVRKEKIAKRLVEEAISRQVIIFTHDIIFTHHLAEEAQKAVAAKVRFTACTVSTDTDVPGFVNKTVFPHDQYEKDAGKLAELYLGSAKQLSGSEQMEKLELGCGALRAAYENFIQKDLFGDVVNRWREPIRATKLDKIYHDEKVNEAVVERFELLSRYEKGHHHSPDFQGQPLDVVFLEQQIAYFKGMVKKYKQDTAAFQEAKSGKKVFDEFVPAT